ncbi:MAG: hypothetical protein EZS28_033947 [Streblomastix strix]|uniref:Uncharacterized protein n=1 Tax=Streblomastix strix TaxID=222440 RepID=A0A5J4UI78_9EUKA|nr:MAG: hypothetical protein EZS28_033947 [Streblomastix strix]
MMTNVTEGYTFVPVVYSELETMPSFQLKLPSDLLVGDARISAQVDQELRRILSAPDSTIKLNNSHMRDIRPISAFHSEDDVEKITLNEFIQSGGCLTIQVRDQTQKEGYFSQGIHRADVAVSLFVTARSAQQRLEKELTTIRAQRDRIKEQCVLLSDKLREEKQNIENEQQKVKEGLQRERDASSSESSPESSQSASSQSSIFQVNSGETQAFIQKRKAVEIEFEQRPSKDELLRMNYIKNLASTRQLHPIQSTLHLSLQRDMLSRKLNRRAEKKELVAKGVLEVGPPNFQALHKQLQQQVTRDQFAKKWRIGRRSLE